MLRALSITSSEGLKDYIKEMRRKAVNFISRILSAIETDTCEHRSTTGCFQQVLECMNETTLRLGPETTL